MRGLQYIQKIVIQLNSSRFKKQFASYLAEGIGSEDIEEIYTNAYAAIRENPEFKPTEKTKDWKAESLKYKVNKLTLEQRKARIAAKIKNFQAGGGEEEEEQMYLFVTCYLLKHECIWNCGTGLLSLFFIQTTQSYTSTCLFNCGSDKKFNPVQKFRPLVFPRRVEMSLSLFSWQASQEVCRTIDSIIGTIDHPDISALIQVKKQPREKKRNRTHKTQPSQRPTH